MNKMVWNLSKDLDQFEFGDSSARVTVWKDREALFLKNMNGAFFLKEEIPYQAFSIQAEVAIPEEVGFIGFIFGSRDSSNFELVYLGPFEIQYDPIMNGSMTWQIYHGPYYQTPLPDTTKVWRKFRIDVQEKGAWVYLDEDPVPQLVIPNLQHGKRAGKIGFWNFVPVYIRELTVEEIEPKAVDERTTDFDHLKAQSFVTEWVISEPYLGKERPAESEWKHAFVEENGTLNVNRLYPASSGATVQIQSTVAVAEEKSSVVSFGFSDHLRLWMNDEAVYDGSWNWSPPKHDGRIRPDFVSIPVSWQAGSNTIRAELSSNEKFGWGISLKTGLTE
ncbi:hypothetical protein WMW72_28665 [Paenibacillus filicis]|uniref:Uncharacterized protein n=1 Tax=Paenibacillus filicis TaxID=669464 RepID=A0ABU9DSM3_9BACL